MAKLPHATKGAIVQIKGSEAQVVTDIFCPKTTTVQAGTTAEVEYADRHHVWVTVGGANLKVRQVDVRVINDATAELIFYHVPTYSVDFSTEARDAARAASLADRLDQALTAHKLHVTRLSPTKVCFNENAFEAIVERRISGFTIEEDYDEPPYLVADGVKHFVNEDNTVINCTSEAVTIVNEDSGRVTLPPSGVVARREVKHDKWYRHVSICGMDSNIARDTYGQVVDLPRKSDVYLLVTPDVAHATADREDLLVLGPEVRDADGTIIGYRGFVRVATGES